MPAKKGYQALTGLLLLITISSRVKCELFDFDLTEPPRLITDTTTAATPHTMPHESSVEHQLRHDIDMSNGTSEGNRTLDWGKVEETFTQYLSDDEILQKWELMEANMKSGMRSLLRTVFPKVVSMSSDAKVSSNCSAGILKWIVSLRHMKRWAIQMLDATGKPPSGIFEGVVTMFGNYDECLKIRVYHEDDEGEEENFYETVGEMGGESVESKEFFRGQYCVAEFKPWLPKKPRFYGMNTQYKMARHDDTIFSEFAKMSVFFHFIAFRMDLCVPSTCTQEDMQRVATLMANLAEFRARVLRCEIDNNDSKWIFDWSISLLICLLILALTTATTIATLQDCRLVKLEFLRFRWLGYFSIRNSWRYFTNKKRFDESSGDGESIEALSMMRLAIFVWIITVHTFLVVDFQFFREMQTLKSWASKWPTQIITNSLFQFDCLLLITAFAFGYTNIANSNCVQLARFLITRYVKLTVLITFMIVLTLLMPFFIIRGPLTQDFLPRQTQSCQNKGWINLLMLQNYLNTDCLSNTWIFCVEFQLMLLLSPLMVVYHRMPRLKWLIWLAFPVLLIIGFLYNFISVYAHHLPPTYYWSLPDKEQRSEYFTEYYYKPWAHLSVFTIGFYAGLYRKLSNSDKKSSLIDQNFTYFGYFLSVFIILSFTFGFHDWIVNELPNEFVSALYNSCQNVGLAAAYSWILFCLTDPTYRDSRSMLHRAIHSRPVSLFARLTLAGYLILPLVQTFLLASQQQHLYSSVLLMFYVLLGNVILTYLLALCISLLIEIPSSRVIFSTLNYLFQQDSSSSLTSSTFSPASHVINTATQEKREHHQQQQQEEENNRITTTASKDYGINATTTAVVNAIELTTSIAKKNFN